MKLFSTKEPNEREREKKLFSLAGNLKGRFTKFSFFFSRACLVLPVEKLFGGNKEIKQSSPGWTACGREKVRYHLIAFIFGSDFLLFRLHPISDFLSRMVLLVSSCSMGSIRV